MEQSEFSLKLGDLLDIAKLSLIDRHLLDLNPVDLRQLQRFELELLGVSVNLPRFCDSCQSSPCAWMSWLGSLRSLLS
jgi:hypothetical protein